MQTRNKAYLERSRAIGAIAESLRRRPERQRTLLAAVVAAFTEEFHSIWRVERDRALVDRRIPDLSPLVILKQPTGRTQQVLDQLHALIPPVTESLLGMFHYPVQIAAGLALIDRDVVQLDTGEGKTIVGLYPEVTFGLLSQVDQRVRAHYTSSNVHRSVHVMTANPYLAERDARWLGPVLAWFGLKASRADHRSSLPEKLVAFSAEVVFGTPSDFIFSYLHEQLAEDPSEQVIGSPYVLLVDEIDHALVDEARIPYVIRGSEGEASDQLRIQHIQVHHLGPLAAQMAAEPRLFVLDHGSGLELRFTELGYKAVEAMLERFLVNPQPAQDVADSTVGRILPVLELVLAATAESVGLADRGVQSLTTDGGRLSPLGTELLKKSLEGVLPRGRLSKEAGELVRLLRQFESLMLLARDFVARLTLEERRRLSNALRKEIAPALISESRFKDLSTRLLQATIESVLQEFAKQRGCDHRGRLESHVREAIRLVQSAIAEPSLVLADLERRISAIHGEPVPQSLYEFVGDLERLWLAPLARLVRGAVSPELRDLFLGVRLIVEVLLQSSTMTSPRTSRERSAMRAAFGMGRLLAHPTLFIFHPETKEIALQIAGRAVLRQLVHDILRRDLWPGVDGATALRDPETVEDICRTAESMLRVALEAHLFHEAGNDYRIQKGETGRDEVTIIDKLTGFALPGRRWSGFLHAFIEKKEGLPVLAESDIRNQMTIQAYAGLYDLVTGMSGTAVEAADEFHEVYRSAVCEFPPNRHTVHYVWDGPENQRPLTSAVGPVYVVHGAREVDPAVELFRRSFRRVTDEYGQPAHLALVSPDPVLVEELRARLMCALPGLRLSHGSMPNRKELDDRIYRTIAEKEAAVIDLVAYCHRAGMPVLVETTSIRDSKRYLDLVCHRLPDVKVGLLNAEREHLAAQILNLAGRHGAVTVATQMAGRGVDIILQPEAAAAGGLVVIGTQRLESRRWDRQISGRTARQGDLGTAVFYLSLDDDLLQTFGSDRIGRVMDKLGAERGERIEHPWVTRAIMRAQRRLEAVARTQRIRAIEVDGALEFARHDLLSLHALSIRRQHPCAIEPDAHPWVSEEDDSPLCPRCRERYAEEAIGHRWIRRDIRRLVKDAIASSLQPILPEDDLVRRYAPEWTIPAEWDLEDIARSLTLLLSAPVDASDLGVTENWRDRRRRMADRSRAGAVPWLRWWHDVWLGVSTRPDQDERDRKVNLSEGWSVEVERQVLRSRIREIIDDDAIRYGHRVADGILAALPADTNPADARRRVADALSSSPGFGWVAQQIALMPTEVSADGDAHWRGELRSCVHRCIADHSQGLGGFQHCSDPDGYAHARLRVLLEGIIGDEEPEGSDAHELFCWAEAVLEEWYLGIVQALGKPTLYYEESRLLRRVVDAQYFRFTTDLHSDLQQIRFESLEQRARGIQTVVASRHREVRAAIGSALMRAWPEVTKTSPVVEPRVTELWTPPGEPCTCGSGIPYQLCCGDWVYRITRP